MVDKKVSDEDIIRILRKHQYIDPGVIDTHKGKPSKPKSKSDSDDKDPASILKNFEDTVDERNKDMDVEILVERDEFGKVKFIIQEKEEDTEKEIYEASEGTEFSEVTESTFAEARIEGNVIRNVCLLSSLSLNNRRYLNKALDDVAELASGVKVFSNHPEKGETRSVKGIVGQIENPYRKGEKLYGNLRVLSSQSKWVFAIAKEMPNLAGLSILAKGKIHPEKDSEGREQVESVTGLRSIDLVSEPASTSGLYEQKFGIKKDGTIGKIMVGNKFDKNAPVCPMTHKVLCPVYSETDVNYENCKLFKGGENCPYSEGGEFYRKTKEEISDSEVVDIIKK